MIPYPLPELHRMPRTAGSANKVEEGGGGYLGYGWDSAIWGVNMLGKGENLDPETLLKLRRTPRTGGSATRWRRAAAGT